MDATPHAMIQTAAQALGVRLETIRKWKTRGRVPYRWRFQIAERAGQLGAEIPTAAFDAFGWRDPDAEATERAA